MKRVKQLGSVEFKMNPLFIKEEMTGSKVQGEVFLSAAGSHVVYETAITTPYITLDSGNYGWIDDAQRQTLIDMWNDSGTTYVLTYDDDSTETVRIAREKPMTITPIHEGACYFTITLPLAKI